MRNEDTECDLIPHRGHDQVVIRVLDFETNNVIVVTRISSIRRSL